MDNADELERFVEAQAPVYPTVLAELAEGRKRSHWMWFVFPQMKGLGHSEMSHHFGIDSREEAEAYWHHPLLGLRLSECTLLVLRASQRGAFAIFGSPDDLKFHSSMTLFAEVAPASVFEQALELFFEGTRDSRTLALLRANRA